MKTIIVDQIPIAWVPPVSGTRGTALAIWLTGFSGTKEAVEPQLRDLANAGFTAVSFDPWQHGERRVESNELLVKRIVGNIRNYFWPILAQTAEETSRVIDWGRDELGVDLSLGVRMGGISMGGDIALASTGLDPRISRVSACIATPDWLRLGSHEPPGMADTYAWLCYARGNPMTNLQRYAHRPAITIQCGKNDTQVPPDGASRFNAALEPIYRANPERLNVTLHEGIGHQFTDAMWKASLAWFAK